MKEDKVYQKLKTKMEEVAVVRPQTLGPLTAPYKWTVSYFKVYPWLAFALLSLVFSLAVYLFLGVYIVYFVSVLQHGF